MKRLRVFLDGVLQFAIDAAKSPPLGRSGVGRIYSWQKKNLYL